jgi:allantoicase
MLQCTSKQPHTHIHIHTYTNTHTHTHTNTAHTHRYTFSRNHSHTHTGIFPESDFANKRLSGVAVKALKADENPEAKLLKEW